MNRIKTFALMIMFAVALASCSNSGNKEDKNKETPPADSVKPAPENKNVADTAKKENVKNLTAQFQDFTLGDVAHYSFKDKAGKEWDFNAVEDTTYTFSEELPEKKSNTHNQGFTSNKNLQGKWFDIKYVMRDGRTMTESNMDTIAVIIEVKMKQ